MTVKAIVAGAAGRMGKRIIHMIQATKGIELVGAFERLDHPDVKKDIGEVVGLGEFMNMRLFGTYIESLTSAQKIFGSSWGKNYVLIDFTNPNAALVHAENAANDMIALVSGTTGIKEEMLEEIKGFARLTRTVMAPNMSVGVNVMFKIAGEMARMLGPDYDMEILEVHHRLKKDAPSGTAMKLGHILADAAGRDLEKVGVYERKGMIGERTDEEIGIQTWRAGDITGEHTVMFGGIGERLELIHRAHNRDNFARGAIRAALWVVDKEIGLYDMQDVLGLK